MIKKGISIYMVTTESNVDDIFNPKALAKHETDKAKLNHLQDIYTNDKLSDMVLNADVFDPVEYHHELVRRFRPVYMDGQYNSNIRAGYFVSRKHFLGNYYSTYSINVFVIWLMTGVLIVALYFNFFRTAMGKISSVFRPKKN